MSTNSDENPPPPEKQQQEEAGAKTTKSPSTSPSKAKPKFQLGGFMEEVKKAKEDAQQRMKQGTEKFQSNMKQSTEKLQSKFAAASRKESASPSSSPADLVPEETAAEKESDTEEPKKHHHVTLNPKKMAQSVAHGIEKTVEKTKDVVTIHKKDKAKLEQQQKQSSRAAEEQPLIDSSAGASLKSAPAVTGVKDEPAPDNKKVFPALNMPSTSSSEKIEPLDDEKVVAIIVASFLVSSLLNHWREMVANQMPASVVFTFSLASFYAGQYIEPEFWKHAFQEYILCGPEEETVTTAGEDQTELHTTARDLSAASIAEQQQKKKMPIFFRGLTKKKSHTTKPFSALSRSTKIPIHTNSKLLAKLLTNPMYRSKGVDGAGSEEAHIATTTSEASAGGAVTARRTTSRMGSTDTSEMQNPKTGSVNTLCEFRGMDVFLTEDAEERMGDHPFLIE